ncbi:hypothetical protein VY88_00610 [Azospirillum thiophilum]|uniref:Uncharacterized protein n=1 Tax=Azospirillum thiophilum TaxID=528244 RepID=A0AAC8VY83_9PROT|nr:hypothetical protein AL072_12100 [Azospirillum thiophilum]KJR64817.1 hypothetical protein VY88_00610 [Azospirillum thiophilum]
MRQACEISALREDLERLAHEAGALRDGVERAVEEVRDRFAALSAEQMADPMALAPLLQLAVTTLLEIREQARRLDTQTGALADDERPSRLGAADAPRLRPAAAWDELAEPPPRQSEPPRPFAAEPAPQVQPPAIPFRSAAITERPLPAAIKPLIQPAAVSADPAPEPARSAPDPLSEARSAARPADGQASWLASEPAPVPPPSRAATVRNGGTGGPRPAGGIDWLGPAGR